MLGEHEPAEVPVAPAAAAPPVEEPQSRVVCARPRAVRGVHAPRRARVRLRVWPEKVALGGVVVSPRGARAEEAVDGRVRPEEAGLRLAPPPALRRVAVVCPEDDAAGKATGPGPEAQTA